MAEILEVLHLAQEDGVAEVEVGRGGVEAGFDAEGAALLGGVDQPLAEVFFADDLRHALAQVRELFVDGHGLRAAFKSSENRRDGFHLFRRRPAIRRRRARRDTAGRRATTRYARPASVIDAGAAQGCAPPDRWRRSSRA